MFYLNVFARILPVFYLNMFARILPVFYLNVFAFPLNHSAPLAECLVAPRPLFLSLPIRSP